MTNTDRRYGVSDALAWKAPVLAATTANITLSGEQTIDGIAIAGGDRVLVKDQSTAADNGIYVASPGNWERAPDADGARDLVTGTSVLVNAGAVHALSLFTLTTAGAITVGTTAQTWTAQPLIPAGNFRATSMTSTSIGTGPRTFATQSGKGFVAGDFVMIFSDADNTNFMGGQVTAYGGTSLSVDITTTGGAGTLADWTIRISGPPGPAGATGTGAGIADLVSATHLYDRFI
jgi:phage-related tail fiber protein